MSNNVIRALSFLNTHSQAQTLMERLLGLQVQAHSELPPPAKHQFSYFTYMLGLHIYALTRTLWLHSKHSMDLADGKITMGKETPGIL